MKKIIDFLDRYFEDERKLHSYRKIPDINIYNKQVLKLRKYLHKEMYGNLGDVEQNFKAPDIFYPNNKNDPLIDKRTLFKISYYTHPDFKELYIAYVSSSQLRKEILALTDALFILAKDNELCIAKRMVFSDYNSDNGIHDWIEAGGIAELNFDNIINPIKINLIKKPSEIHPGFEVYNANI